MTEIVIYSHIKNIWVKYQKIFIKEYQKYCSTNCNIRKKKYLPFVYHNFRKIIKLNDSDSLHFELYLRYMDSLNFGGMNNGHLHYFNKLQNKVNKLIMI